MQLNREELLRAYRTMRMIRAFEERLHTEFATGESPGFVHLYAGEGWPENSGRRIGRVPAAAHGGGWAAALERSMTSYPRASRRRTRRLAVRCLSTRSR